MDEKKMITELISIGLISYSQQETARQIIFRCLKMGVPTAATGMYFGANTGTVFVPGVGTVSGALIGALAGLAAGTMACVALNYHARNELKSLVQQLE